MLYTVKDLMEMFSVSDSTVGYWKSKGIICPVKRKDNKKGILFSEDAISRIRAYKRRKARQRENCLKTEGSLCWQCIKVYGTVCSWAAAKIPVDGWDADEVFLYGGKVLSYRVLQCPQFEEERFIIGPDGIKRRANEVYGKALPDSILDFFNTV